MQSHRGAGALSPENSLEAFDIAWKLGTIPEDRRVGRATREGTPFVLANPRHPISRRFSDWAVRLSRARR